MKKKLILLCVLCCLVLGLAVNAYADNPTITIGSANATSGATGVEVPVSITGNPGFTGFDWTLTYDTDKLECTGIKAGIAADALYSTKLSCGGIDNFTGDGTLFTLLFNVKSDVSGDAEISIAPYDSKKMMSNEEGAVFDVTFVAGKVSIAAHTHDDPMTKTDGTPATCQADGTKDTYYCAGCGKTFIMQDGSYVEKTDENVVITSTGTEHKLKKVGGTPATCTSAGTLTHDECEICHKLFIDGSEVQTVDDPIKAHELEGIERVEPTCTEGGNIAYWKCKNCDAKFLDAAGIDTKALTTAGTEAAYVTTLDAKGHQLDPTPDIAADAATGQPGVYKCKECGYYVALTGEGKQILLKDSAGKPIAAPADGVMTDELKATLVAAAIEAVKPAETGTGTQTTNENAKNSGTSPKTGDETNIALWIVLFVLCAATATVVVLTKKAKKN